MSPLEAKKIIVSLAHGISPDTGEILAEQSALNSPQVIRALHEAAKALESAAKRQQRKNSLPGNAGRPWSDVENRELVAAFDAGDNAKEIALKHGRTLRAIATRLVYLGRLKEHGEAYVRAKKTIVNETFSADAPADVRARKTIVEKTFSADAPAHSPVRTEPKPEPEPE